MSLNLNSTFYLHIQTSSMFYATAKKAFISSTFDEQTCKALIGTEMSGRVVKQECEAYEYIVKDTGEMLTLTHRYVYELEEVATTQEDRQIQNLLATENAFSKNGQHKEEFVM